MANRKAPYLSINGGDLLSNDELFKNLTALLGHCSEYHITCDYCPNKFRCDKVFGTICDRINHEVMNFEEMVRALGKLLPMLSKKNTELPIIEAMQFLHRRLKDGPKLSKELIDEAKEKGIAYATLHRARIALGVKYRILGFSEEKKSLWFFPKISQ